MTGTNTSTDFLEKLACAAQRRLSDSEIRAQRVSFVLSAFDEESPITKAKVEEILKNSEGETAA